MFYFYLKKKQKINEMKSANEERKIATEKALNLSAQAKASIRVF